MKERILIDITEEELIELARIASGISWNNCLVEPKEIDNMMPYARSVEWRGADEHWYTFTIDSKDDLFWALEISEDRRSYSFTFCKNPGKAVDYCDKIGLKIRL